MFNSSNPFWRKTALSEAECNLVLAVMRGHHASTFRDNVSTNVIQAAALANGGDYIKSITSGLLTFGGIHGPMEATYALLDAPDYLSKARGMMKAGKRLPGWGCSFVKGRPDPNWDDADTGIRKNWPEAYERLARITGMLQGEFGKDIYPNPSAYTALTAILVELPPKLAIWLLVQGRLGAWSEMLANIQA